MASEEVEATEPTGGEQIARVVEPPTEPVVGADQATLSVEQHMEHTQERTPPAEVIDQPAGPAPGTEQAAPVADAATEEAGESAAQAVKPATESASVAEQGAPIVEEPAEATHEAEPGEELSA
jgi:hypothetical protein